MRQKSSQVEQNCERRRRRKKCEMSNCYQIHFHGQLSLKGRNLSSSCINNAQRFSRDEREKFRYLIMKAHSPPQLSDPLEIDYWLLDLPICYFCSFHGILGWHISKLLPSICAPSARTAQHLKEFSPPLSSRPHFVLQYRVLETNKRLLKNFPTTFFPPFASCRKTMSCRYGEDIFENISMKKLFLSRSRLRFLSLHVRTVRLSSSFPSICKAIYL